MILCLNLQGSCVTMMKEKEKQKEELCLGCMSPKTNDSICPYCGYPLCGYAGDTPSFPAYVAPGVVLQKRYLVGRLLQFTNEYATYIGYDYVTERKVLLKDYSPMGGPSSHVYATAEPQQKKVKHKGLLIILIILVLLIAVAFAVIFMFPNIWMSAMSAILNLLGLESNPPSVVTALSKTGSFLMNAFIFLS